MIIRVENYDFSVLCGGWRLPGLLPRAVRITPTLLGLLGMPGEPAEGEATTTGVGRGRRGGLRGGRRVRVGRGGDRREQGRLELVRLLLQLLQLQLLLHAPESCVSLPVLEL